MTTLHRHQRTGFAGFGPSILALPTRGKLIENEIPADRMQARAMLHDRCPVTPGVYGWLDHHDQICYVGKSKALRKRLLCYFAKNPTDKKAERIRQHSQRLVWEPISDELLALIREQELIHRWRPDFNTQGQPTRRQPAFVCISTGPAPNVFLARQATTKAARTWGPIAGTSQLRTAIESLNQVFRLRDCSDKTTFEYNNQQQLFGNQQTAKCIRFEIGSCPAPCAGKCSRAQYREQVDQAISFLDGRDLTILATLQRDMSVAAAELRFERATVLRDHLTNLQWLARRLNGLRNSQQTLNGVLPIAAINRKTIWLFLRGGRLIGSSVEPGRAAHAEKALITLTQTAASPLAVAGNILEMQLQLIVGSWFRNHPQQKKTLLSFDDAMEFCKRELKVRPRIAA